MPVSTGVDLYLAKSVGELNSMAEIKQKQVAAKVYVRTAEKLIADANHSNNLRDEEKAYVLFMRYFNIITIIKKSPDYKKDKEYFDSLIGRKNLLQAIEKAEKLSKSLTSRYELLEAEQVSKKLEALEEERERKEAQDKIESEKREAEEQKTNEVNVDTNGSGSSLFSSGAVSASSLYDLLQSSPNELIIMDTRSASEFADSHLRHKSVINVPVEIIQPGTTVPRIELFLPSASKELWSKRAHMEYIILLDWNSKIDQVGPGKTLQSLKDALFKFDSKTFLKSEPLILEGGYDEWCLYYPTLTTQPVKDRPIYTTPVSNIPSLDFDYPDLDAAFLKTPTPKATNENKDGMFFGQSESSPSLLEGVPPKSRPNIPDRTKKPSANSSTMIPSQNSTIYPTDSVSSNSLYPSVSSALPDKRSSNTTTTTTDLSSQNSKAGLNQKTKSNFVAEQEQELEELQKLQSQKQKELLDFKKEKERMVLEHKARLEQLKKRQSELDALEKMKHEQEKDVADLMRLKRRLAEEMKIEKQSEEDLKLEKAAEERKRTIELERMKVEEDLRIKRLKSVEQSRYERKQKEENDKIRLENLRIEEEAAKLAEAEKLRLRELEEREKDMKAARDAKAKSEADELIQKAHEEAQKEAKRLEMERLEKEKLEKELEIKKRQEALLRQDLEREEIKKKEEELKRLQEEKRLADEKARLERERIEAERRETERKEKERKDRIKAEEARKIAEERARKIAAEWTNKALTKVFQESFINYADKKSSSSSVSNMLPVGWERKLDKNTNRYFYLNHNEGTSQWDPPQITSATSSPAHSKVYKTKLKDENDTPRSGGLMRSHSSPNIAQLIEDEGQGVKPIPNFNRGAKPAVNRQISSQSINSSNKNVTIKSARMRDLNPVYGSVGTALTGLRNLGNTCYMNSTLQCLNNCVPLVSYFQNDNYLQDINRESKFSYNGEVVDEFAVIIRALWLGQYRSISAREFKNVCSRYNSAFANYDQQDSQEFLAFLLDGLHEGLNTIKMRPKIQDLDTENLPDPIAAEKSWANHKLHNESIIVELFQGVLKSSLTCLACGKKSTRFDVFQYLTLPLPSSSSNCSIQDCLKLFLREEKLTGSSQWRCPRCKVDRDAVKKLDIWKLPHILIIHLNRFFYEGVWRQKLNTYVDFPVNTFNLDNIVAGPKRNKPYNLYAVSNHYGTMEGGHYTAYGKNPISGDWHTFDDQEVRSMSRNNVKSSAAYFLFYTCLEQK